MKHLIKVVLLMLLLASCQDKTNTETIKNESVIQLKGKVLKYDYGDDVYRLNFISENQLHWKCLKGDEKGAKANETYATQQLNDHTFFVSWIEENGLGVSQVLNLKKNTVNTFLKIDKEIITLTGTIQEL